MSYLGEAVLKFLVSKNRSLARLKDNPLRGEQWEPYIQWQFESSRDLFARYPNFDLKDKTVLEIGCGTGGRSAYLGSTGAKEVVAIDINAEEIAIARRLCPQLYPQIAETVCYLVCSDQEPLEIGPFDVVVLADCLEHVVSPPTILRLAYHYLKPGGKFYFSSVGWYHHMGSHTRLLPFVNVFFSDETILNVMRWWVSRPDYVPTRFDSDPPVERWRGLYNLRDRPGEHLNKITIREMKKLLRYSLFSSTQLHVCGFSSRRRVLRLLDPLRNVPVIQEVYHSIAVGECRR